MGLLIALFLGFHLVSVIVGKIIVAKLISPRQGSFLKHLALAFVWAGFYTPTVGAGGHGIAVLPALVAFIFTEQRYLIYMLPLPIIVFTVSLLYLTIKSNAVV